MGYKSITGHYLTWPTAGGRGATDRSAFFCCRAIWMHDVQRWKFRLLGVMAGGENAF